MVLLDVDDVLEILSNNYRREILRLLTNKDRYAFELSKILGISQRAVTNHLKYLQEIGLVISEKRKSSKGPEREYFCLNEAVILSLTVAPNLFLATVRPLEEKILNQPITPSLQLNAASDSENVVNDVIEQGLSLLPQIKEGLDVLQSQQNRLLRGYQGLQSHISEILEKEKFTAREIRIILILIERDGQTNINELEKTINLPFTELSEELDVLEKKKIIKYAITKTNKGWEGEINLLHE